MFLGKPCSVYRKFTFQRKLLVWFKWNFLKNVPGVQKRYLMALQPLD